MRMEASRILDKMSRLFKLNKCVIRAFIWVLANMVFYLTCGNYFLPADRSNYVLTILALIGLVGFLQGAESANLLKKYPLIYSVIILMTTFQIGGYRLFFVHEVNLFSWVLFLCIAIWTFYYLNGIIGCVRWMQERFVMENEANSVKSSKVVFVIVFGIIILVELIMLYIYYPGIYSADSLVCYQSALNIVQERSDIHSFLYVCLIALCSKISVNCIVLVVVCGVAFALVFALYMKYLYQLGMSPWWIIGGTLFFCLMPNNIYMPICVWKDIPYTISLLSLTYALTKWIFEKDKVERSIGFYVHIIVSIVFVALFRSNGLVVLLGMLVVLGIKAIRHASVRKLFGIILVSGIIVLGIKGPLYTVLNVTGTPEGFASIPFVDGVWANANAGVELPVEIEREMEKLFPYADWKERYRQGRSNVSIWDLDEYNKLSLKNVVEWYGWCMVNSPKYTIQNRLMKTDFMWSYFRNKDADFTFNCVFDELQNDVVLDKGADELGWFHFENTHKLRQLFNQYVYSFYEHFQFWFRGGFHLTLWFLLCVKTIFNKRKRMVIVVLPILLSSIALMIGTCYADYRYIWGMEVMTWFILPIYMLMNKSVVYRENVRVNK